MLANGTVTPALDEPRTERVDCPSCGSADATTECWVRDHEFTATPRDSFPLRRCARCDLLYLSPRPVGAELGRYYPASYANYNTDASDEPASWSAKALRAVSVRTLSNTLQRRRMARLLRSVLPKGVRAPRILDVGCGDGHVLNLVKGLYPQAETVGVEMDAEAARRAGRRHHVLTGTFDRVKLEGTFDLVFASHVIEHVPDPRDFLVRIAALLRPGARAILDTPNVDTPLYRWFGRHWGGLHAPRHLVLFREKTLRAMAEKADLRVERVVYLPIQVFWIWSFHSLLFDRAAGLADRLFHPQRCLTAPSLYYTGLLTGFEVLERATGVLDGRMGQMRMVLTRA